MDGCHGVMYAHKLLGQHANSFFWPVSLNGFFPIEVINSLTWKHEGTVGAHKSSGNNC